MGFKTGATKLIHFTGGSCATCGVAIDDELGQAVVATSKGYLPVQLSPLKLQQILATGNDVISGNFGYDPVDHLILSPNYRLLNFKTFESEDPDYQILRMRDGAAFTLSDAGELFNAQGECTTSTGGTTQRDALPDSGAYDTTTQIAYGTFRSPADCVPDVVEDIALLDLSQATYNPNGTWSTPGKQIQTLSENDESRQRHHRNRDRARPASGAGRGSIRAFRRRRWLRSGSALPTTWAAVFPPCRIGCRRKCRMIPRENHGRCHTSPTA